MFTYKKLSDVVYSVNHNWSNKYIGEIYMEVDGFFVFEPAKGSFGYWDEASLLELGSKLKEMNSAWAAQIEKDLKED